MSLFKLTIVFACFSLSFGEKARFDNYRVYSIKIQNEKQLEMLQGLENSQDGIVYIESPISIKRPAEMIVPPHKFADISIFFSVFSIENEIKIDNLQRSACSIYIWCSAIVLIWIKIISQINRWRTTKVRDTKYIRMGKVLWFARYLHLAWSNVRTISRCSYKLWFRQFIRKSHNSSCEIIQKAGAYFKWIGFCEQNKCKNGFDIFIIREIQSFSLSQPSMHASGSALRLPHTF